MFARARLCLLTAWLASLSPVLAFYVHTIKTDTGKLVDNQYGASGVNATFDYVIVGGGTAGLTMAYRLAQNKKFSVAVIEAGGYYEVDNGNASVVPAYCFNSANASTLEGTNGLIDWMYTTPPQPQLNDRTMHFVRGKTLGGSSARNYMNYNRPTIGTMEKWANEVDDDSYQWGNMQQFYKKSTEYTKPNLDARGNEAINNDDGSAFSANGGPLQVSYSPYYDQSSAPFPAALDAMNIPRLKQGFNKGQLLGYAASTMTINSENGFRDSSQTSFLNLAIDTTSLVTYTRTMTERIIFDGTTAIGVELSAGGQNFTLTAKKEVILSAGVIGSPQLLMVSGVGPAEALKEVDVPTVVDLPGVGQNMHDNPVLSIVNQVDFTTSSSAEAEQEFRKTGTGRLASTGSDLIAFTKLNTSNLSPATIEGLKDYPEDHPWAEHIIGAPGLSFAALLATFSRGNVTIASSDVREQPIINPNWLGDPRDQDLLVALFRQVRELSASPSVAKTIIGGELVPGPKVQSDEDILTWLKSTAYSIYHSSCTCKMGKESDPMAVVDSDGKVFGTKGLRVVDASAMPFLPPGQPQATIYALAEKIAARILDGH